MIFGNAPEFFQIKSIKVAGEAFLIGKKNTGFLKVTGKFFFFRRGLFLSEGVGCGEEIFF